jgi:hypothetical protein
MSATRLARWWSSLRIIQTREKLSWEGVKESGWYWWDDGEGMPVPVRILEAETGSERGKFFAPSEQLGWTRTQLVEEMGGKWMLMVPPEPPKENPNAEK